MVGALIANYTQRGFWKKGSLFLMTIPLIFLGVMLRFLIIFGLASAEKADLAMHFYHDFWSDLFSLGTVVGGLFLTGWVMKRGKRVDAGELS